MTSVSGSSDAGSEGQATSGGAARPTLAIVDDSEEVRALVRTRLELSGLFEIVGEGADGSDAIGLAYRHEPDLMLLDTSMPEMDGLEALPAILTLAPDTRVVMFTGFEEHVLADRARDLGAVDFVEKSVHIEDLPDRLWRVLGDTPSSRAQRSRLRVLPGRSVDDASSVRDQAVLDEHLKRFREVFDRAAIGMATLTLNGSIVRANAALAAMMASEPADLVGVDYGRLTRGHGDELDRGLASIADGQDIVVFEHPLPTEASRTVRVALAPVRDSKDRPLYVFAQIQDISAQRLAEDELHLSRERFRLLVTAVAEYAIFMLDPDGRIASWNAGAQRIKGYRAEEVIGRHFRLFYLPEERASGHPEENLARALRDGSYAEEGWRLRKDGTRFWASVVITAVYDEQGHHVGFAKVTHDRTEQRLHAEQRQEAVERQNHLLAVTAHELRTPTAVIDGSASMLLDHGGELGDRERAQLLNAIRGSAARLQRLVSDLSTASRVQDDALRLSLAEVPVAELLSSAVDRLRAVNAGVAVRLDLAGALEGDLDGRIVIRADAGRVGQALDNLLDNAVRHGRPEICVRARMTAREAVIAVADAGPGVPAELMPRLFERFAIAGPAGGTGLGLYLVREIARRHGGDIRYDPPGAGRPSTFTVRLPISGPDSAG